MPYFNVIKLDAIDSTNEELKRRHHAGLAVSGDLIWAEEQRKGKGQRSASWSSEPLKNLTFSIYLTPTEELTFDLIQVNMQIALAVHSALESFSIPQLRIKWPNDILSGNKKIGGVLIESIFRGSECVAVIIGLGINVNQTNFPALQRASSMAVCAKNKFSRSAVLSAIQKYLSQELQFFESKDKVLKKYNGLLYKKDHPASFRVKGKVFTGCIRRVNAQGMLVVENEKKQFLEFGIKEVELLY